MEELKKEPMGRLLLRLIIPSLAIVMVSGSYNIIDGIFLGRTLGVDGSSANSYTFMIYAIVYGFSALVSQGAASLLAIELGEKNIQKANRILGTSVILSVIIAVVQSLVIFALLNYILTLFGTDIAYYSYIKEFCVVLLLGSPFYFVAHTLLYCLRAQGNIRKVLLINVVSFFTNLISGAVLITGFRMGFTGSALSTVCANVVMCIILVKHFVNKNNLLMLEKNCRLNIDLCKEIVSMGMPFFLTNLISIFLLTVYNRIAFNSAGEWGIAALSIASSIYRYIISLMNAITNGVQPVVGYNYGAREFKRVTMALRYSFLIGTIFTVSCFLVIQLGAYGITGLFNSESKEFIEYTSLALKRVLFSLPLQGIVSIGTNYFQYIGKGRISTFLVLLRQIVLQIPLAFVLSIYNGINGLWDSYWLSDLLVFFVIVIMVNIESVKLKKIYGSSKGNTGKDCYE